MRVAAVVPAHNEALHLARVVADMPELVDVIIVIDDASSDATFETATALDDARVVVVRHATNTGVGGAVITGHRTALEHDCDVCVVMAGDGQMDPDYLPALLGPVVSGSFDYAKGNRFATFGSRAGMPRNRVVGNILLSIATKVASGYYRLFDSQNGYTAISAETLRRLPLDRIATGYSFENDMLIYLNILRARVIDVAIPARYGEEVSGIRMGRVIPEMTRLLFGGLARRVWLKYVVPSFGAVAMLLLVAFVLGVFALGVAGWAFLVSRGTASISGGTAALVMIPGLTAIICLAFALYLDMSDNPGTPVSMSFAPPPGDPEV